MGRLLLCICLIIISSSASAQYNVKKMMEEGRRSLDAGYYLVAMQFFDRIVALKPELYEAWWLLGKAKYHLADYDGAEHDCSKAILLNPYIADIYDLRALVRIREEKYDSAAIDYTTAIEIQPDNPSYWFNRAVCYYRGGNRQLAITQLDYIIGRWRSFKEAVTFRRRLLAFQ